MPFSKPVPIQKDDATIAFLHIPKTGGITFRELLYKLYQPADIAPVPDPMPQNPYNPNTVNYKEYPTMDVANQDFTPYRADGEPYKMVIGHYDFDIIKRYPHLIPITMLREPISRVISQLRYTQRTVDSWNELPLALRLGKLDKLLELDELRSYVTNSQTRQMAGTYWSGQSIPDDELLDTALHNLVECAFVGLQEHFDDSLLILAYTLGIAPITHYQSWNIAPAGSSQSQVSRETYQKLAHINNLDIELYEYAKLIYNHRMAYMIEAMQFGDPQRPFTPSADLLKAQRHSTSEIRPKRFFNASIRHMTIEYLQTSVPHEKINP